MSASDHDYWSARYAASEGYLFGEAPNHFLASVVNLLPTSGRALAVADGEGRNGVFLAEHGLDVVSVDFSPVAQERARALAEKRGVRLTLVQGDAHEWDYPTAAFDVVVEIFTQFSSPDERALKWAGMRRALKPGGVLVIQGYTTRQLERSSGGPRKLENLYTEEMLRGAFADYEVLRMAIEERTLREGAGHEGMAFLIGMVWRKPA
ncbi:MAG: methyltransferase domain-containing protein [Limimaricola sp.]|uniref:class I SAM-dependent methyltransferase n=1 Tax=Limimaricola sp. TaxID=2211665 RepID=UPI001D633D8A|nr:methyltransferase domain-containing protein [Limimaricola sp.]MBI1417634.1 methyltransferase domain-containing protein [Limimaricola sp.]